MADAAFLLDTNICIYLLAGLSSPLRARVEACRPGELVTSAIVFAELMRGVSVEDQSVRERVLALFNLVPVLPFERDAAIAYGGVPLRRGTFDHLIAAHAVALDVTLVTNNERDFARVPGLRIENWTVAP